MKKIALILAVLTMLAMFALPSFAAVDLDNIADAQVYEVAHFLDVYGSLRAMAIDPDGEFAYCGQINASGIVHKVDLKTGETLWTFEADNGWCPKLVAADDRGNVFLGLTNPDGAQNVNYLAILNAETGEMQTPELITFTFPNGLGCSFNGGTVANVGGKYLLFSSANYGAALILCFDVTEPTEPVLYENFGEGGIADIVKVCGVKEGSYGVEGVSVDTDGSVWAAVNFSGNGKGDGLAHISADGKKMLASCKDGALRAAFNCCVVGDQYVAVCSYDAGASCVTLVNKADMTVKATGLLKYENADNYCSVLYVNDEFYIANQSNWTLITTDKAFYHDPNVELAEAFKAKVEAIEDITADNFKKMKTRIVSAESAMKDLTDEAKALIDASLFDKLTAARKAYDEMAAAAAETQAETEPAATEPAATEAAGTEASGDKETEAGKTEEKDNGATLWIIIGAVVVVAAVVAAILLGKKKKK